MAVCAVAALILGVGSARFSALAGQGLGANIRKAEYGKLQSYSFSNIDHFSVSSLVTRLTSDVTNIQNAVSTGMRPFGRSPVMLIFATTLAFRINSTLALVFLVALPILAVLLIIIIINVGPRYGRMQGAVDLVNRCIEENLTAVRVVKSYVRGDYEIEKFRNVNDNLKNESEKAFGIAVLNMPAMQFVMYSTILGILLIGGRLINSGQMMIGQLTSFLSYVLLILNSLMMMSNVFLLMTRSLASAERIMKIIDEPIDITDENAKDIEVKKGEIEFNHLTFIHRGHSEPTLNDITLHVPAGTTLAIIGRTGNGKSTLVNLLLHLYNTKPGMLFIDGKDINTIPLKTLRENIGYVPQDNFLFSDTLKSNIAFGAENDDMEAIQSATRAACIHENIVQFPDGYETIVGERGVTLSGGQKQRSSIARALMKNAPILILDDALSAVDTDTEEHILTNLKKNREGKTTILIAHRISTIQNADIIMVLEDGTAAEIGNHDSLMAKHGIYYDMFEKQQLEAIHGEAGKALIRQNHPAAKTGKEDA